MSCICDLSWLEGVQGARSEWRPPAQVPELCVCVWRLQPFHIFLKNLFLSPFPICSFRREGLEWEGEWDHFSKRELKTTMRRRIYPSWSGSHPHLPFHAWAFHSCLFLDSSLSIGFLKVGDTQGSVLPTSLFAWQTHPQTRLQLPLVPDGIYVPALEALLNSGPSYQLRISNWMSPTYASSMSETLVSAGMTAPPTSYRNRKAGTPPGPTSLFLAFTLLSFSILSILLCVANPFLLHPHCVLFSSSLTQCAGPLK